MRFNMTRRGMVRAGRSVRRIMGRTSKSTLKIIQMVSMMGLCILVVCVLMTPLPGDMGLYIKEVGVHESVKNRIENAMVAREVASGMVMESERKVAESERKVVDENEDRFGMMHARRIMLGTFNRVEKVGIWRIHVLEREARRFDTPWMLWERAKMLSLEESGYRVLYSSLKTRQSDGVGHALTVVNGEVSTAINLGLTYSHRTGFYGSLGTGVEEIFGWGASELSREWVQREICETGSVSNRKPRPKKEEERCTVCKGIRKGNKLGISQVVVVPQKMSLGCVSCAGRQRTVRDFMRKRGRNHTIYQISTEKCDMTPKAADFTLSRRHWYWKYWDAHANTSLGTLSDVRKTYQGEEGQFLRKLKRRGRVNLDESELTIAVHARRGDFLHEKGRRMISLRAFRNAIWEVKRAVDRVGGVFSDMPVAVIIYSEGRRRETVGELHDVSQMDRTLLDIDGQERDAVWMHVELGGSHGRGNGTHSWREKVKDVWENGIRVELRVSTPLEEAFHEMASADVFIGSASDLSQYAIRMVSRAGVQVLPEYGGAGDDCCRVTFHARSGVVMRPRRLVEYWRMFARANGESAARALERNVGEGI